MLSTVHIAKQLLDRSKASTPTSSPEVRPLASWTYSKAQGRAEKLSGHAANTFPQILSQKPLVLIPRTLMIITGSCG